MQKIWFVLLISGLLFGVGCGGGSSHGSSNSSSNSSSATSVAGGNTIVPQGASNVAPLIVDAGPTTVAESDSPSMNVAFTTVVVCAPSSPTTCATIDHVAVDIGSSGLRIPASVLNEYNSNLLPALQNVNASAPVAECVQFLDNTYLWGTVRTADVEMGGANNNSEVASSVPIEVIGDTSIPTVPDTCSNGNSEGNEDTVAALGANGLIGVGNYQYDCDYLGIGNPCTSLSTLPPGTYYSCAGSSCSPSPVPTAQQVRNPVSLFTTTKDDNGVILELPSVPIAGQMAISAGGALVFGIGTESNNGLGSAVVLTLDSNENDAAWLGITTVYNGVSYPHSIDSIGSFLDSGSNGLFFLDQPTSGIPDCDDYWYCPPSTESLTAVNEATGGNSSGVQFNVADANTLFANVDYTAFSDLAGPNTFGSPNSETQVEDGYFDWGLPFFYGRNVYTAIWGVTPPSGVPAGPFWAY